MHHRSSLYPVFMDSLVAAGLNKCYYIAATQHKYQCKITHLKGKNMKVLNWLMDLFFEGVELYRSMEQQLRNCGK